MPYFQARSIVPQAKCIAKTPKIQAFVSFDEFTAADK